MSPAHERRARVLRRAANQTRRVAEAVAGWPSTPEADIDAIYKTLTDCADLLEQSADELAVLPEDYPPRGRRTGVKAKIHLGAQVSIREECRDVYANLFPTLDRLVVVGLSGRDLRVQFPDGRMTYLPKSHAVPTA